MWSTHRLRSLGFAIVPLLLGLSLVSLSADAKLVAERKVVEYLKANLKPGEPVVVSKLYNEVFTSAEDRQALDRLYNIFFKVPLFVAQYYATSKRPPSLEEIAHQFNLPIEGEADTILKITEYDRRVPKFITRDPKTGEIVSVDLEKIKADSRFNKVIERTIAGWEGKIAPAFTAQGFDGKEISLDGLKGQTRLVYFWFTHCPPCMQITPHLVSLQEKFGRQGLMVIGLNADRLLELDYTDSDRKAYLESSKVRFPVGHLTTEVQSAYGGVQLFPTLFLVDKEGVIRGHFVNYQSEATLENAIRPLL
jgi:cytochrome c biogenesis protein CcmG, thiol:disulfide interchange protein DsbE